MYTPKPRGDHLISCCMQHDRDCGAVRRYLKKKAGGLQTCAASGDSSPFQAPQSQILEACGQFRQTWPRLKSARRRNQAGKKRADAGKWTSWQLLSQLRKREIVGYCLRSTQIEGCFFAKTQAEKQAFRKTECAVVARTKSKGYA